MQCKSTLLNKALTFTQQRSNKKYDASPLPLLLLLLSFERFFQASVD